MATLSGGDYITFKKPYIKQVADAIEAGDKIEFEGRIKQVVNMTTEVKLFLEAVKGKREAAVEQSLKIGAKYSPIFNGYKWTNIEKSQFTGKGLIKTSDGATTAKQEKASLYAIKVAIEKNGYSDRGKFFKEHRDALLEIYPEMNEEWEETFFQQQITVVREVGNTRYTDYSRDDGFMDWITNFCKTKYGIIKKDSWNPADVWLVNDIDNVKRILQQKIIDDVTPIKEFNAILRDMFHERKVVGISLKKMSGKTALWELVNLENDDLFDNDEYSFSLQSAACDCTLKDKNNFKTTDSRIKMKSKKQTITFQIRQNSAGFNNLKIEGSDPEASSARLGKVPLPMAANVFKAYGLTLDNSNRNYPKSAEEFIATYDTWGKIYNKIKTYTNVDNEPKWRDNMIAVYNSNRADFAHSKLMQMKMFGAMFSLKGKELDSFLTELAFLAQKKGSVFGPFGKLY